MPPGPSNALSPAGSAVLPGAGGSEPGCQDDEDRLSTGARTTSQAESQLKLAVKKKQKNMLARASPAALHLQMQSREPQQLNGSVSPSEDGVIHHQHAGSRPEDPASSVDNSDSSCSSDGAPVNNSEQHLHKHEGPFSSKNHSPLVNNSLNGMPAFIRTEAANGGTQPSRPLLDAAARPEGGVELPVDHLHQPPEKELARLELSDAPGRVGEEDNHGICYVRYESELQMPWIMRLITKDLSEPYSIYTYRYFIHNWPQLCFLAMVEQECVGAIVCKLDMHKKMFRRGYIAMLAVDSKHRRKSIGTNLVKKAIYAMVEGDCDEVVLETEITNKSALKLYENLGFVRDKRLFRYYLNGVDALRLKLWLR